MNPSCYERDDIIFQNMCNIIINLREELKKELENDFNERKEQLNESLKSIKHDLIKREERLIKKEEELNEYEEKLKQREKQLFIKSIEIKKMLFESKIKK